LLILEEKGIKEKEKTSFFAMEKILGRKII